MRLLHFRTKYVPRLQCGPQSECPGSGSSESKHWDVVEASAGCFATTQLHSNFFQSGPRLPTCYGCSWGINSPPAGLLGTCGSPMGIIAVCQIGYRKLPYAMSPFWLDRFARLEAWKWQTLAQQNAKDTLAAMSGVLYFLLSTIHEQSWDKDRGDGIIYLTVHL